MNLATCRVSKIGHMKGWKIRRNRGNPWGIILLGEKSGFEFCGSGAKSKN